MYITIVTDYDNMTDKFNKILSLNCTINENNIDINVLLLTIPCGISFLCLISLLVYTLIKPLFNKKRTWINIYILLILYVVSNVDRQTSANQFF